MSVKTTIAGTVLALCAAAGLAFLPWFDPEPKQTKSEDLSLGAFVSGYLMETVVVIPQRFSVDSLILMFNANWLSPKNQSLIVRAIGNLYQTDAATNSVAEKDNAKILDFLRSAADDPRDPVAGEAALAYLQAVPSQEAVSFLRSAAGRRLPAGEFVREALNHLFNLDHAEQEQLIDDVIAIEQTRATDDRYPTLSRHLNGLLTSRIGVEMLSGRAKETLLTYLNDNAAQFTVVPSHFLYLGGMPLGQLMEARAWLSGVSEHDLLRYILDQLLAPGEAPDTVVMMMSSHLADELIAFASPTERQSLRSIVLKAGQDARAPADEAARQYRDYALRRLGV